MRSPPQAKLAEEISPVYVSKSGGAAVTRDNGPRTGQSREVLGKLRPVFDRYGTRHGRQFFADYRRRGGPARGERSACEGTGISSRSARLTDYAYAGCDPARMGLGPVSALERLEARSGHDPGAADLVEINEAFAAQVLAVLKVLRDKQREIPLDELNVNGGAIALGHPVGATGARLVLTALKELARRKAKSALVSLCVGGGQGGALWLERFS